MSTLSRFVLASAALGLAACTGNPQNPDAAAPEAAPEVPPAAEAQLPVALVGTFDETPDACADPMTSARMTVSPDSLLFYFGYATVERVMPRADGYDLAVTFVLQEGQVEVVPEPATYHLKAGPDGGIHFSNSAVPGFTQTLVRCAGR